MTDQPPQPSPEPKPARELTERGEGDSRIDLQASGDVTVGGDVAGRDVVKTTQTITNVGLGEKAVQRLLITVGAMVFVTAACFFSGGVAVGAVAINAFNIQAGSSLEAAQRFHEKLQVLQALPAGQAFTFTFTQDELSSYVKFVLSPQLGFKPETGKARLLEDGQIAVTGQLQDAGGLPVLATFKLQDTPGAPLSLQAAAIQVLPLGEGSFFGWVAVPPAVLQPIEARINSLLGNVQLSGMAVVDPDPQVRTWRLDGAAR